MGHWGPYRRHPRRPGFFPALLFAHCLLLLLPYVAGAEIRIVSASGEHVLGPHDTREEAIRLATEAAKRDALEQVATYVESITFSHDLDISRDEIRSYTAGVVNVLDQHLTITAEGEQVTFHIDLATQIDTDEVDEALKRLREDEDVRQDLVALKAEVDQLQQDLDRANQMLAGGIPPEEAQELADRRTELLNQLQSNALVQQAWTEWMVGGAYVWPYGYGSSSGVTVPMLLAWAGRLYPDNPHVPVVAHIVTTRAGAPMPPAPPQPPSPPGNSAVIPTHQQLVTPLPIPANAVIGNVPDARGFRRLQAMFPQYGTASSSLFMQRAPGTTTQPSRPAPGNPTVSSPQRLRQFLAPPTYAVPPSTRAVPTPTAPPLGNYAPAASSTSAAAPKIVPGGARGLSHLQHTYQGSSSRSAPLARSLAGRGPGGTGRVGGGPR